MCLFSNVKKIFIFQQLLSISSQTGQLADRQIGMLEDHGVRNQKLHREGVGFPFIFVRVELCPGIHKDRIRFLVQKQVPQLMGENEALLRLCEPFIQIDDIIPLEVLVKPTDAFQWIVDQDYIHSLYHFKWITRLVFPDES